MFSLSYHVEIKTRETSILLVKQFFAVTKGEALSVNNSQCLANIASSHGFMASKLRGKPKHMLIWLGFAFFGHAFGLSNAIGYL